MWIFMVRQDSQTTTEVVRKLWKKSWWTKMSTWQVRNQESIFLPVKKFRAEESKIFSRSPQSISGSRWLDTSKQFWWFIGLHLNYFSTGMFHTYFGFYNTEFKLCYLENTAVASSSKKRWIRCVGGPDSGLTTRRMLDVFKAARRLNGKFAYTCEDEARCQSSTEFPPLLGCAMAHYDLLHHTLHYGSLWQNFMAYWYISGTPRRSSGRSLKFRYSLPTCARASFYTTGGKTSRHIIFQALLDVATSSTGYWYNMHYAPGTLSTGSRYTKNDSRIRLHV